MVQSKHKLICFQQGRSWKLLYLQPEVVLAELTLWDNEGMGVPALLAHLGCVFPQKKCLLWHIHTVLGTVHSQTCPSLSLCCAGLQSSSGEFNGHCEGVLAPWGWWGRRTAFTTGSDCFSQPHIHYICCLKFTANSSDKAERTHQWIWPVILEHTCLGVCRMS